MRSPCLGSPPVRWRESGRDSACPPPCRQVTHPIDLGTEAGGRNAPSPKVEGRRSKKVRNAETRNPNPPPHRRRQPDSLEESSASILRVQPTPEAVRDSAFGFRTFFDLRPSTFGFRYLPTYLRTGVYPTATPGFRIAPRLSILDSGRLPARMGSLWQFKLTLCIRVRCIATPPMAPRD